MIKNKLYISSFILASFCGACNQDNDPITSSSVKGLEISAEIANAAEIKTRVELNNAEGEDGWSFSRFSDRPFEGRPLSRMDDPTWKWEEALGFFSQKGDNSNIVDNRGTTGPFENVKMEYAKSLEDRKYSTFVSTEIDANLNDIKNKATAYFPYTQDVVEEGLELRWVRNGESLERCIDALIMRRITNNGTTVSGMNFHFYHAFSEIVITRGEGFDNPPAGKEGITIVLENGYSHARIVDSDNSSYYKIFDFYYKEGYCKEPEDCRYWETWKRSYTFTQSGKSETKDAWYAILPAGVDNRPNAASIIITDNYGTQHIITDFLLYNQEDKSLYWNDRYFVEIKLEGLVPTVSPVVVEKWGEDQLIAPRESAGISSTADYEKFVTNYNLYNNSNRNNRAAEEELSKYGDKTTDLNSGKVYWHFYFVDNVEFSSQNSTIDILYENDIIDGFNSDLLNLTNVMIKDLRGELIGLNITVNMKGSGSVPFGPIAGKITGGKVNGCSVRGTVNCSGQSAGMLAGILENGTVEYCTFSGLLIAASTHDKIIGATPSGYTSESNSTSGVILTTE